MKITITIEKSNGSWIGTIEQDGAIVPMLPRKSLKPMLETASYKVCLALRKRKHNNPPAFNAI